ncbi:MAG TPA: hypothetical protein V6D14_21860 [Coleofasciculaceae cyanobacterium]
MGYLGEESNKPWIEAIRKTPYYDTEADRKSDRVPMHPARVIAELRKATPNNTVIVADSGAHTFFTGHNWTSYAPNECLILTTTGRGLSSNRAESYAKAEKLY